MPETNVTTAMTAPTPMTTPSNVSTERSLFAQSDCSATRMASLMFMNVLVQARSLGGTASVYQCGGSARCRNAVGRIGSVFRKELFCGIYNETVGSRTGRPLPALRCRERKVRTPQSSVPDNVRERTQAGRVGSARRKVPQKTNRRGGDAAVRVKRCGKSAPPLQ